MIFIILLNLVFNVAIFILLSDLRAEMRKR